MKRIAFFITILTVFLASCSGKAYDEALQKGYHHLENAEYSEASEQFTLALDKKETEEAENALRISDAMFAGWDAIRAGTFNSAVEIAHNILTNSKENEAARIVIKDAEDLLEQAEELLATYEDIVAKMDEADLLFDNESYKDALIIYEEIASLTHHHFVIENLIAKALDKVDETKSMIEETDSNDNENNQQNDSTNNSGTNDDNIENDHNENGSNDNTNNNNDKNSSNSNDEITKSNAEQIIREGVGVHDGVNVKVDHEDNGYYIIQVFEIVGEGDSSHTATWGWYKVNKKTGDWEEAF